MSFLLNGQFGAPVGNRESEDFTPATLGPEKPSVQKRTPRKNF
jgi:hypothetical protein